MNDEPRFLGSLREDLLSGLGARQARARRRRRATAGVAGVMGLVVSGVGIWALVNERDPDRVGSIPPVSASTTSSTAAPRPTDPDPVVPAPAGSAPCVGSSDPSADPIDLDSVVDAYNDYDSARIVAVIGDGPVDDPSLDLGGTRSYPSVAAWTERAEALGDRLEASGYGYGDPVQLFANRRNALARGQGIETLSVTLDLWVDQDCEWRIASSMVISSPDPCQYDRLAGTAACDAPYDPRTAHVAVWTGDELLIYGGQYATHELGIVSSGLALDPQTGRTRPMAPSPVALRPWPALEATWTGEQMLVVGHALDGGVVVLSYDPVADSWDMSPPHPETGAAVGAVVWTGEELILFGGDQNQPERTAWSYDPNGRAWAQLPDPPIDPVQQPAGVWAGDEAIFYGGYTGADPDVAVAFDPLTRAWRTLSEPDAPWIQGHRLAWTGDEVLVYSGHTGPGHPGQLLIYDPASDRWRMSAPLPIAPTERLAGAWTGDRLILWGGLATYGMVDDDDVSGQGAAYDPVTDSWTVLADAPIADRCDLTGTWTGSFFVAFGGATTCGSPNVIADGHAASYDPAADSWQELGSP